MAESLNDDEETTWIPRPEAADAVQVGYQTLRSWERAGHVRSRKRGGRVEVALEDARRYAVTSSASPLTRDDVDEAGGGGALPMRREEMQRILDKALGADEWAHRAGVAETKADHQAERLRDLREELKRARAELMEARTEVTRLGHELDRARAALSPRQRRRAGLES